MLTPMNLQEAKKRIEELQYVEGGAGFTVDELLKNRRKLVQEAHSLLTECERLTAERDAAFERGRDAAAAIVDGCLREITQAIKDNNPAALTTGAIMEAIRDRIRSLIPPTQQTTNTKETTNAEE